MHIKGFSLFCQSKNILKREIEYSMIKNRLTFKYLDIIKFYLWQAHCIDFLFTRMWETGIKNLQILKKCQFIAAPMLLLSSIYKKMDLYIEFQINYKSRRRNTKRHQLFISWLVIQWMEILPSELKHWIEKWAIF